jgi:hypothetical protein
MPEFNALAVVEPLKFDFNPYYDLEGTIPEPTEEQLGQFFTDIMAVQQASAKSMKGIDPAASPEKMMAALAKLPDGSLAAMLKRMNKPYAALCSGFPSEEDIGKLPPRVRLAFFTWLGGELNPEHSGAGLIPAPTTVS